MFTVESVSNLVWANKEKTIFTCDVKYKEFDEVHPSGIDGVDPLNHIKEIWDNAKAGVYGEISEPAFYPIPSEDTENAQQPTVVGAQTL